jgi:hypothetical protein
MPSNCCGGGIRATTTAEVIQEFAHVRASRRSRVEAAQLARQYITGLGPLIEFEPADLFDGLDLFENSTSLGSFDAVLAAVARRRGWAIASADVEFGRIDGLLYHNPATTTFLQDLMTMG